MKNYKLWQTLTCIGAAALLFACVLSFFAPFPRTVLRSERSVYECAWENGGKSQETYSSAFAALSHFDGETTVIERGGVTGYIAADEEACRCGRILHEGKLNDLLSLDFSALDRLHRAALARTYAQTVWYADGEYFAWNGNGIKRTDRYGASVLSVLAGEPKQSEIERTGARIVKLHGDGRLTGKALRATLTERIEAFEPYVCENGVLYKKTPSGIRLIAALPSKTATIAGNAFADEGALLPCTKIEEVAVPFCGSDLSGTGEDYRGEFAHLFAVNREYAVPDTLRKITVTGGGLIAHAFYGCEAVKEIDCCSVKPDKIDLHAFADCAALETLHAPREDLVLPSGQFDTRRLACGCTMYERRESL